MKSAFTFFALLALTAITLSSCRRLELPPLVSSEPVFYRLCSSCDLPTSYGTFKFCVFRHCTLGIEAIACVSPKTLQEKKLSNIPLRIHDACMTSETFYSLKCDCRLQLNQAMEYISAHGGLVIYLNQEGRGIGLANKIAAYDLQETCHLDTVQANRALGLPDDVRDYIAVKDILDHFGIDSVLLMTNNLRKRECLEQLGIAVVGRIPCVVKPQSPQMKKYMQDKAEQMGHLISIENL